MLRRKWKAWFYTTIFAVVIYAAGTPVTFFTLLHVLPFLIAGGAALSVLIELITRNLKYAASLSLLLHIVAAYLIYKMIAIPVWSIVVYLFAFPIAMIYWGIDELLKKKSYNKVESVKM